MPLRGGGRRLMAKTILNFHFDYLTTPLILFTNTVIYKLTLMNSSPHAGRWTLRLKSRWRRAPCWRGTTARCSSALGTPSKTCLPQVWGIKQTSRCIIVLFAYFCKHNITYSDKPRFRRLNSQNLELESDWRGHSWGLLAQHLDKLGVVHNVLVWRCWSTASRWRGRRCRATRTSPPWTGTVTATCWPRDLMMDMPGCFC